MWLAHGVGQSFKNNLNDQVKQLTCLQSGDSSSIYLQEYHLQSIYHLLLYEFNNFPNKLNLNSTDLSKIVKICTKVVETPKSVRPNHADIWRRCELWALKILILVVKQPSLKHINQKTLKAIHNSLIKLVRLPEQEADPNTAHLASLLTCLAACCLSQIGFDRILSPEEANQLITKKLLPLAIYHLNKESKHERGFLDVLMGDFHGVRACRDGVFTNKSLFTYPQLVQLLMKVMRRSDAGPRGYRKRFEITLNLACSRDHTSDEDIVALNVLVAHYLSAKDDPIKHLGQISLDLLTKSLGLHRIHIAFLLYKCFATHSSTGSDIRDLFMDHMVDDWVTKNDNLLVAVAFNSIWDGQDDVQSWESILAGKQVAIICKLMDRNCQPNIYDMFLRKFRKDSLKYSEFDNVTLKPITLIIDNVYNLIHSNRNDSFVTCRIRDCLKCLKNFLKLRQRRLGQDLEFRLNQAIELLIKNELFIGCIPPDGGELLVKTNMQQVYPSAWRSIIELIRHTNLLPIVSDNVKPLMTENEKEVQVLQDFINIALPHLIMVDEDHFYTEIGSLEVIEMVYEYCKRLIESESVLSPMKEILLTWPADSAKSRLDLENYQPMLNKFIRLLVDGLERANKRTDSSKELLGGPLEYRLRELLNALSAVQSFHREVLYDVLDELESDKKIMDRNAWLMKYYKVWDRLTRDQYSEDSFGSVIFARRLKYHEWVRWKWAYPNKPINLTKSKDSQITTEPSHP